MSEQSKANLVQTVFPGEGEMSRRMRDFDWGRTALGPAENWPQSLRTAVSICLASRFPIVLYWGPEFVVLYNDAYSQILGAKHPWALGQTCHTCWAEIWDTIGPMLDGVVRTGKATWSDDLLLMLERFGYPEECYFSFSFSPVQAETGVVGGIFTAVIETTEKVIGERRLRTLRDLAARGVGVKNEQDVWQVVACTLAENDRDVPFAVLCKATRNGLQVAGTAGISDSHALCEELCRDGSELFRKARQVSKSGQSGKLADLGAFTRDLPSGAWRDVPHGALLLPISIPGQGESGLLLAAVSPAKALDDGYRTFFDLLARQIATSIADARSFEEDRNREERLRTLVNATSYVVYRMSPDWSEMWQLDGRGFISEVEKPEGNWIDAYVPPEDQPAVRQAVRHAIETKTVFEMEHPVRRIDGTLAWTLSRAVPLFDSQGNIVEWFGAASDISARKVAEEARRRLAAIVESSGDAIVSKDLNGIVTSWNRQAERLFGYTEEEMIGRSILAIIPPELHGDEDMILSKIRSGQKIDHFETIRMAKSGEKIEVSLSISPVRDEQGNVVGAAKIARDIRESKKIEQTLRTTEKLAAAGRLAATVSHEINNPLEAVTNLVYLAKRALPPEADVAASHLGVAESELSRVAHIARQTLGFYRDTSSPVCFHVARALDDLLLLYERRLKSRKIRIVKDCDHSIELTALAGEIRQAFSNLITNAMDAMPGGGTLRVRVRKARSWNNHRVAGVRITIADSGMGITPEHRRKLFQPFFTTKADVGTGLGLWITRGIVDKHGGNIKVRSKTGQNDHGTAFSIFLPLKGELKAEQSAKPPSR